MRDNHYGDGINTRITGKIAFGQFWQFTIITLRQIFADFAQLFFDNMKIINQPFGGGRNRVFILNRFGERTISGNQDFPIVFQTRQKFRKKFRLISYFLLFGKRTRKLFKPFDAEQFGADRLFIFRVREGIMGFVKF